MVMTANFLQNALKQHRWKLKKIVYDVIYVPLKHAFVRLS